MSTPVKLRHYTKSSSLPRRDSADLSPEALRQRSISGPFSASPHLAKPENPSLIPSCHGPISRILFTIPEYAVYDPALSSVYRDLFKKLPPDVLFTILTHENMETEISAWHAASGNTKAPEIISIPHHLHFSIWAEDGYVAVKDLASGAPYFVEPFAFRRYGDGLVADFVSNATDMQSTQAPLYFEGGNCLIGDDFFFIGADYPANTIRDYVGTILYPPKGAQIEPFIRGLYKEYLDHGRELFYIGSTIPVPSRLTRPITIDGEDWVEVLYAGNKEGTVQPLFHIDMFVTLAGRDANGTYHLMVGCPKTAHDLLGTPLPPHAMQEVFNNIARNLERQGFIVHRNPLPLIYMDDARYKERMWYFATSNNALVSIDATKQIWLPTYGHGVWPELEVTDNANRALWEKLGFTVHMLGDFHPFAENLGAVHCIKKYLSR